MYEWPRFAQHLGDRTLAPTQRLRLLLASLGVPRPEPSAEDILTELFTDGELVAELAALAPHIHHVGIIAPPRLDIGAVTEILSASPFAASIQRFTSAVLVRDLAALLGLDVHVTVVQGSASAGMGCPAVEVFITDLPERTTENLLAHETGCHVALALAPGGSFGPVRDALHAHGCREIPLMSKGELVNRELGASVLYVDVAGHTPVRRLEFISQSSAGAA
jgi:hypothetical protein